MAVALAVVAGDVAGQGQREVRIRGDRLSGFVLPVEPLPGDIQLRALRGQSWTVDDTQRLILSGDVRIVIAGRSFASNAAVVWINRLPSAEGLINQIAVYFDQVTDPTDPAGLGIAGRNLLITGSARGEVMLNVGLLDTGRPRSSTLLGRGEARLAEHLRQVTGGQVSLEQLPQVHRPKEREIFVPEPGREFDPQEVEPELPKTMVLPAAPDDMPWLGAPGGSVRYSAEQVDIASGEDENVITLVGPLVVDYITGERTDRWQRLTLTAERGVIFTDPGSMEEMLAELSGESIRGIYLEGNVIIRANEDDYVVRSPRVYYDFRREQAIMLDAVLRTYSREHNVHVYARANELRQVAEDQWEAQRARVSTSAFFKPHLALGAERMTLTERPEGPRPGTYVDARHITLRAGDVPFLYWPRYVSRLQNIPLQRITLRTRSEDGLGILTRWNLFTLLGKDSPEGVEASLAVDGFTKRGVGLGVDGQYRLGKHRGAIDLYGMYDDGTDRATTGRRVEPEDDLRGVALWEHHVRFNREWSGQFQTSWISDPTFITAHRPDDFRDRREYETSAYLKRQTGNSAFTVLAKYELNDFISNDYLLASRQYQVDKLPEITYRRYGDSLGDVLTYSTENRVSRVRLVMQRTTPAEAGVRGRAFGISDNDRIDEALRAMGLPSQFVNRADSRHELAMPFSWGIFKFMPFAVGRVTVYDEKFEALSPDHDDYARFFGAAGLTVTTQFQRVDNSIESRLFDLHRVRHVIEPRFTMWYGYNSMSRDALPIYDEVVESVGEGFAVQVGVRNRWQTQRGGPGRWRLVDFLTIDTSVTVNSNDAGRQSPTPQFFDFRPEHSQFGDHIHGSFVFLPSDNFAVVGEGTYDFDERVLARASIGAQLRHSPVLSTYAEFRYIEASDHELLDFGWDYRLTPKYRVVLSPRWDLRNDEFRAMTARVVRSFPDFDFVFLVRYDRVRGDVTVGATIGLAEFLRTR